jgi:hypothetical protein
VNGRHAVGDSKAGPRPNGRHEVRDRKAGAQGGLGDRQGATAGEVEMRWKGWGGEGERGNQTDRALPRRFGDAGWMGWGREVFCARLIEVQGAR